MTRLTMKMMTIFYNLIFLPFELFVEMTYAIMKVVLHDSGWVVIFAAVLDAFVVGALLTLSRSAGHKRVFYGGFIISFLAGTTHFFLNLPDEDQVPFLFISKMSGLVQLIIYLLIISTVSAAVIFICSKKLSRLKGEEQINEKDDHPQNRLYLVEMIWLTIFMGAFIPLNVVSSSPTEFVGYSFGPAFLVVNTLSIYIGVFMVWGLIIYHVMPGKVRSIFEIIALICMGVGFINATVYGHDFGSMTSLLSYEGTFYYSTLQKLASVLIFLAAGIVLVLIYKKLYKWLPVLVALMLISPLITCGINIWNTYSGLHESDNRTDSVSGDDKILTLTSSGQNVIVIMLDRAISGYLPYIFEEKPELVEQFDGFVYYTDCMSFGGATNYGSPAIFGGYEYTPAAMNARDDMKLVDKHNEALLLMPKIFSENGYHVTVCDPPTPDYQLTYDLDLSLYDGLDNVDAYVTAGKYNSEFMDRFSPSYEKRQLRAFFYHSIMRMSPPILQGIVYRDGQYMCRMPYTIRKAFLDWYCSLLKYPDITAVTDDDQDQFLLLQNGMTHDVSLLKTPEYIPMEGVSMSDSFSMTELSETSLTDAERSVERRNMVIDNEWQAAHFESNVAALMLLGEWFDKLRDNGCWDNTRIIIVADHGNSLHQFDYMMLDNGIDAEAFNPLLMMKDFGASGRYSVCDDFMTNADVPTMAMDGLIDDPVNPFTGNKVDAGSKDRELLLTTSGNHDIKTNNGSVFDTSDGQWYSIIPGSIFDVNNWIPINDAK